MKYKTLLPILLLLTACANQADSITKMPDPTHTLTPSPEPTPSPTSTSTSSPTPTLSFPVNAGTPFPTPAFEIDTNNANELREIARFGGEMDILWAGDGDIQDTNHGVITSINSFPPSEVQCVLHHEDERAPKVFFGNFGNGDEKIAIVTSKGVDVFDYLSGELLHTLILPIPTVLERCPTELFDLRISRDIELVAVASKNSVDIYSIETGELIHSIETMVKPRMFSPEDNYLAVESKSGAVVLYRTSDWKAALTISTGRFDLVGFSVDEKYAMKFPDPWESNTIRAYSLEDDKNLEIHVDELIYRWEDYQDYLQNYFSYTQYSIFDANKESSFLVEIEPAKELPETNSTIIESEYYFSTDGMSLLATRPYIDPSTNLVLRSPLVKEICVEVSRSGEKLNCITPLIDNWIVGDNFSEAYTEAYHFEDGYGAGLQSDGQPYWYSPTQNSDNNVMPYFLYRYASPFSRGIHPRELCTFPFESSPTCAQEVVQIFPTTLQPFTLLAESETQTDVIVGVGDTENLLTSIQHDAISLEFFNSVLPWVQLTPDQKKLIYVVHDIYGWNHKFIISILDIESETTRKLPLIPTYIDAVSISPDSHYAGFVGRLSASSNYETLLLDLETNNITSISNRNLSVSPALAFSSDNQFLVYVEREDDGKGAINFFSIQENVVTKQIDIGLITSNVSALALSPKGDILAVGLTNGIIRLFDTQNSIEVYSWDAHNGQIKSLEFSPNGRLLLSVGLIDQYAKLWGILP
ncbi:MAG: hypothetical protein HN391_09330 [Anaerolineae bacterium]|nr:hypothetical protein [Anaerolineae bacterium]